MAKSRNVKHTRHVKPVGKRITKLRCWQGAGNNLRPKRTRPFDKANDASTDEATSRKTIKAETSASGQSNSKKRDSKN